MMAGDDPQQPLKILKENFGIMLSRVLVGSTLVGLLAACATSQPFGGFDNPHRACYAYTYGEDGVETDYEKALAYCREGSIDGYLSSMTLLAELHYNGHGTPADLTTALRIYEMAAARGHRHAQLMVFLIYNRDLLETSSCEEKLRALAYLREAADSGYEKAVELLSIVDEATQEAEAAQACSA